MLDLRTGKPMATRRDCVKGLAGIAGIIAAGQAPAAFVRSMVGARFSSMTSSKDPYDFNGSVIHFSIPSSNYTVGFGRINGTSRSVDWGDGVVDVLGNGVSTNYTHTYQEPGDYYCKVGGIITQLTLYRDASSSIQTSNANSVVGRLKWKAGYYDRFICMMKNIESVDRFEDGFGSGVTAIDWIFQSCQSIKNLYLPDGFGVNASCSGTFIGMYNLEQVRLPVGFGKVNSSCYSCFDSCRSLKSIDISHTNIGVGTGSILRVFAECGNLSSIVIPDDFGVSSPSIQQCFSNCPLESINLPSGFGECAVNIGRAFVNSRFVDFTLPSGYGSAATNAQNAFTDFPITERLILPDGCCRYATNTAYCFERSPKLKYISVPEYFGSNSTNTTGMFSTDNVEELIFHGESNGFKKSFSISSLKKLTVESILSIFTSVQDVTDNPQTLTIGSTNLAKLSSSQIEIATQKGWAVV